MVEEWRRKSYYRTRVLIDTGDVLVPEYSGILVCLEPGELAMLRQLTQYLHRRSTFVSDYGDTFYVAPSTSEWDDIQAIVAELEDKLMSGCDDIVTALEDIEAQLACLCTNAGSPPMAQPGPAYDAIVNEYLDDGTLAVDDAYGSTVPVDGDRCALAQLTYAFMFEMMDETVIPTEKVLVDIILPLAVGAVASAIGSPLLGVPVAAITATLIALGDLAADNELANLRNALFANKEELVCAMYNGLDVSYAQAHNEAAAVVNDMESLGATDKIIVRALLAPWAMKQCKTVYDSGTPWAVSNVTADYCLVCDEVEGSDWIGIPVFAEKTLSWVSGGWVWGCVQGEFYGTEPVCGVVIECTDITGVDLFAWSNEAGDAPCTGVPIVDNPSQYMAEGTTYYLYKPSTHNKDEAITALCAGATEIAITTYPRSGPGDWEINFRVGNGSPGSATAVVKYIVYEVP